MTFLEFMLTQRKRGDSIGDLAGDMSLDAKLFPSENLASYDINQWRKRLNFKAWNNPPVLEAFETAVKEFESVQVGDCLVWFFEHHPYKAKRRNQNERY